MRCSAFIEDCLAKPRPRRSAKREERRLERRASLAGRTIRLTPELQDPTNPENAVALAPYFPWSRWREHVPKSWGHRELLRYEWARVLDNQQHTVIKAKTEDSLPWLEDAILAISPQLERFRISVPVWYELKTRGSDWRGTACPEQGFLGELLPNSIALYALDPPTRLIYHALHEASHAIPAPGGPLDPEVDVTGHGPAFRERFGLLLLDAIEGDGPLAPGQRHLLRHEAHYDSYAPPLHPREDWLWVEAPISGRSRSE